MTEQEALQTLTDTLIHEDSITGKLALKRGLDTDAVDRLDRAFDTLVPLYKDSEMVPKVIAEAVLDLGPDFERCYPLYGAGMCKVIDALKFHIAGRAHDLLYGGERT